MKTLSIMALALIALGAFTPAYQGITYTTTEKVIDIGPLEVTAERTHTVPMGAVLGVLAVGVGVVAFFVSRRTARTRQ